MADIPSDNTPVREAFTRTGPAGKGALVLASWFGVGLLPGAPGTFGTAAAIPLVFLLDHLGGIWEGVALVGIAALAVWSSHRVRNLVGQEDPPPVVVDEVTGFLVATLFVPFTWFTLGLCFVLFRFFDIAKPFPIKRLEKLRGGWGIVADDVMAGLYTWAVVRFMLPLLQ